MLLAALSLLTVISFSASKAQNLSDPKDADSLTTILASQPLLTGFTAALAGYASLLNLAAKGNCTILAPSDDASINITSAGSADALEAILSYSILQGIHTPVDFDSDLRFYPTYLTDPNYANVTGGQRVGAYITDGKVVFETGLKTHSRVLTANIVYAGSDLNGVIHIIDRVLQIPLDIAKTAASIEFSGVIPTAVKYPTNPDVFGVYGPVPDWTTFAANSSTGRPSDLDEDAIFDDEAYQFVQGSVWYSHDLNNGTQIRSFEGRNLTVTVAPNGTKYVNDVAIIGFDYLTSTGVVHVIDRFLDVNRTDARPDLTSNTTTTNTTIDEPGSSDSPSVLPSHSSLGALGTDAKAGIGIGSIFGAAVAIGLVVCGILSRKRKRKHTKPTPTSSEAENSELQLTGGKHEMPVARSGQEWELDSVDSQRPRPCYEMP